RGVRRVLRSLFRTEHLRDWLLLFLGLFAFRFSPWAGALVALLGAYRLARPLLTDRTNERMTLVENVLAVIAVTVALAEHWLPLGYGAGLLVNLLFVATLVAFVMGGFRLFESSYPRILDWVLRHKL